MNLYDKFAEQFSKTRQNPWIGWREILEEIKIKQGVLNQENRPTKLKILDLGCGNGRFAKYLLENQIECTYIGVDKSAALLGIAKNQILRLGNLQSTTSNDKREELNYIETNNSTFKFIQLDLEDSEWYKKLSEDMFDVVVSFGLMHHLSPFETRKAFLRKAFDLLDSQGFLAVSYWQFGALARYQNKKQPTSKNQGTKYFENDFILNFGNSDAERFCHFVTSDELKELESELSFVNSKTYINDGRDNNENIYRIYFK